MTARPPRRVVSDHDPRVHFATLDSDETLCGVPILIELGRPGVGLVECPACNARRLVLCAHADEDGRGMHWLRPGERCTRR